MYYKIVYVVPILFIICFYFIELKLDDFNQIIFGLISDLAINSTICFFKSLQNSKYKGKIVIFIDKNVNILYYKRLNIEYIIFSKKYPYYPINNIRCKVKMSFIKNFFPSFIVKLKQHDFLCILRYYLIYTFIKYYGNDNEVYLLSDVEDVIFQRNPFDWNFRSGIYLVEESKMKSLKEATSEWMKIYTNNENILQRRVINGGIIFGTSIEMKQFLKEFLSGYKSEKKYGNDQAYLNYFYYSKQNFNYKLYVCEHNKCFCKCLAQDIRFSSNAIINETDMKVYNNDGSIPAMVHQYTYTIILKKGTHHRITLFDKYSKLLCK